MGYNGKFQTAKLGALCQKIGSGATPRGGKDAYLESGPFSLIRSQNVHNNQFITEGLAYISLEQAGDLDNAQVEAGDVLLNITGDSVARCCQAPKDVLPARVNQHVAIIRTDGKQLDPRFLRFFFVSPQMQEHMLMLAGGGATRNALTKGMIENFDVPTPDINEQQAIAQVLGVLDDKIQLHRMMNDTLEEMIHALFSNWFVDPIQDSCPRNWKVGTFGEAAENPRRGVNPDEIEPRTAYIGLEHMPRRCIALSNWGCAEELESNKFEFKRGEILFGKLRPYFHKVGIAPVDGICSTDILVIRPKAPEWLGFILGHISSVEFINYTDAASGGTKMPRTSWQDMARYEITLPPKQHAAEFNDTIRPIIECIIANIHESRTLAALRDALLPKLLSGELRVPRSKHVSKEISFPANTNATSSKKTTDEFVEAVVIAQLVRKLATPAYPLGRKRYNKLAYLAHRKTEDDVTQHYLKKAAGPYSPWAKYGGPERIALKNAYVEESKSGKYSGLVAGKHVAKIDQYLSHYPVCAAIDWVIGKFRFKKNDELELLATVDFAALDLLRDGKIVSVDGIKHVIRNNEEWAPKLDRAIFSDANIRNALNELRSVFPASFTA